MFLEQRYLFFYSIYDKINVIFGISGLELGVLVIVSYLPYVVIDYVSE